MHLISFISNLVKEEMKAEIKFPCLDCGTRSRTNMLSRTKDSCLMPGQQEERDLATTPHFLCLFCCV